MAPKLRKKNGDLKQRNLEGGEKDEEEQPKETEHACLPENRDEALVCRKGLGGSKNCGSGHGGDMRPCNCRVVLFFDPFANQHHM